MSSVRTFFAFILALLLFAIAPRINKDSINAGYYDNSAGGFVIDHTSSGKYSRSADPILEVWVAPPADSVPFNLMLNFRREGLGNFTSTVMSKNPETLDRYFVQLPRLGRGEYYEYYFELVTSDDSLKLRLPQDENSRITLLFEGRPSLMIWGAHVGVMFLAAMYAFQALFSVFGLRAYERNLKRLSRKVFVTGLLMLLGTALIGFFVSQIRFGYYWGGWPFGDNRTQTYLELLILYWLGLTIVFRGTIFGFKPEKNFVSVPTAIVLTLVGVLFMIIVYLAGGHFVDIPL
ncbi:MAG: hypothetical protein WBP29_06675 [Candidatus Zixiibacteriota bacterium]